MIFQNCPKFHSPNNFEISLVVFMSNVPTNHAITYTNTSVENVKSEDNNKDKQLLDKDEQNKYTTLICQCFKDYLSLTLASPNS